MGGDHGISSTLPASIKATQRQANLNIILVGDEKLLRRSLRKYKALKDTRLSIQHASEVVEMGESLASALRGKKDSSMRVALNLVKSGRAQACVSSGNTGALMAMARFVLKTLPGVNRPAIVYALPSFNADTGVMQRVHMLDLGANIDCDAQNLFEFAIMGSILASAVENISNPRVALLNIGEEEIKGLEPIKKAAKLLTDEDKINYTGFIEANDIFFDKADVIVCDGFIGNVSLKTTEGTARLLSKMLKQSLSNSIIGRITAVLALPLLWRVKNKFDIRRYNGASLLGLQGIVIKSHGGAGSIAFGTAINEAVAEVSKDVPKQIHDQVAFFLKEDK